MAVLLESVAVCVEFCHNIRLAWVYGFRDKVKYVMFLAPFMEQKRPGFILSHNVMGCDVICVENIPALLALNPCGYDVYGSGNVFSSCTAIGLN